jgi:hypothetical protein
MLVEGQSEEIFVKQTLAPFLAEYGVYVEGPINLGGVSTWGKILKHLKPLTHKGAWVTTLLDFYGLPEDFPGYQEAYGPGNPRDLVVKLQNKFGAEIDYPKFIPFLALHEFEAWLFCAPAIVADHFGQSTLADKVKKAIEEAGEPELINHGKKTHPKARLKNFGVGYKETSDGATLAQKIGIPAIRDTCPHFAAWLAQLEALGQET